MLGLKTAIIDSDVDTFALLSRQLQGRAASAQVVGFSAPMAPYGYDNYVIESALLEERGASDLINRIRSVAPNSQILAYSKRVGPRELRDLMAAGCDGVYEKGYGGELEAIVDRLQRRRPEGPAAKASSRGISETINAVSSLIREWNQRIESDGQAHLPIVKE